MELIVRIIPEDEKSYFPAECNICGWIGSSGNADGGRQIADTGDYDDIYCPCCHSRDIDETENLQPIASWIDRLKKATDRVKLLTDKMENYEASKYNYAHFEEENKSMAKELYDLKNRK
jgi:hypothetical protein